MRQSVSLDVRALERFDVAVVRVGADGSILYANHAMHKLVARDELIGVSAADLLADARDWPRIQSYIASRAVGIASSYPAVIKGARGRCTPVEVYGVPEVGPSGELTGSLAFVTSTHETSVARGMHQAIESKYSGLEILGQVDALLRELLDYESMRVTAISQSRKHLRQLYSTEREPRTLRWWRVPAFVRPMIEEEEVRNIDVEELFSRPDFRALKDDPATQDWLKLGYRHLLSIPVKQENRTVAYLSLETTRARPFSSAAMDTCSRLPLREAVLMALHYEKARRRDVVIELIQELAQDSARRDKPLSEQGEVNHAGEIRRAAETLVRKLAKEFGWEHVAIFGYDEPSERLVPLSQAGPPLRENFSIATSEGLVGQAFTEQITINAGDVRLPPYKDRYRQGAEGIVSELCIPVPGTRSRWVVNVESNLENAFAEEEVETVQMLVQEAGSILDRTALLEMRQAVLSSIRDAVIETDIHGVIREANGSALALLRCRDASELVKKPLAEFFRDQEVRNRIVQGECSFSRVEADIVVGNGHEEQVMVSGAILPPNVGGKVFVISDLSYARQIQQLDLINEVFRQAALESRVPLAIVAANLRRLAEDQPSSREVIEKTMKQLRKADLPLERLLHLASEGGHEMEHAQAVDVGEAVAATLDELPDAERLQVEMGRKDEATVVRVPRETLSFCLDTMLSFALRTRPQDRKVQVNVARGVAQDGKAGAHIVVEGDWRPVLDSSSSPGTKERWRRRAIQDLALGDTVLKRVAQQLGGEFRYEPDANLALDLLLPLSEPERMSHG